MDFCNISDADIERGRAMMARSYLPTERLETVRKQDPVLAEQIEKLCRAVQALRGFAITLEAHASLAYSASACEPFITPVEAFDEIQRLKGVSRLPTEIRPDEIEEYKRLQRFLNSAKAVQRIVAKRRG
jgi:hypothetical protein